MELVDVRAVEPADFGEPSYDQADVRRTSWWHDARVATPLGAYPRFANDRSDWVPALPPFGVVAEAADGTLGYATAHGGTPVASIVEDYLGQRIIGEDCRDVEQLHDLLVRLCSPIGPQGLASYAVSGVDLALWDLKGRLEHRPVFELLGGPVRDSLACYATGNDTDWYLELGFEANKLACPYGPAAGEAGLQKNEELVADRRELLGPDRELMLDCWMAFDVEYTATLAERLRPYALRWIEEALQPHEMEAHAAVRDRVTHTPLATGEHWHTAEPFRQAVARDLVDILQPDIHWVGGLTTVKQIAEIAAGTDQAVILHCGGASPYGQHASYALAEITWTEYPVTSPPGVALEDAETRPGVAVPEDGSLVPASGPGFGVEVEAETLDSFLG